MKKFKLFAILILSLTFVACSNKEKKSTESKVEDKTIQAPITKANVAGQPTVIDFYATWCGPCKELAPIMEQAEKKYDGKINFNKVDVDLQPEMAQKYNVQSIPTLVFLDANGEIIEQSVGFIDSQVLDSKIQQLLK